MQLVCAIRKDTWYLLYDIKIIKPSIIYQMHQDSRFNVKEIVCHTLKLILIKTEKKGIIFNYYMNPNNPV